MKQLIVLLSIFAAFSSAQKPLLNYIVPCKRNDPNLNECFAKSANRAIVQMVTGDEEYGIPSLILLKHKDVDFSAPGIQLTLYNVTIHGVKDFRVVDPEIDLEKNIIKFYFNSPLVIWEGDYVAEVDDPNGLGTEQKRGHVNFNFDKGKFLMTYQFELEKRNGINYAKIIRAREEVLKVGSSIVANNDENGLTDDEWNVLKDHIITEDFLSDCAKTVEVFIQAIFNVVPYDNVFPL